MTLGRLVTATNAVLGVGIVALFGIIIVDAARHEAREPHFVRTLAVDGLNTFEGTVIPGSAEESEVRYEYQIFYRIHHYRYGDRVTGEIQDMRRKIRVYPLLLSDGSYAGLAVPEGAGVQTGAKVRAEYGRLYYPAPGTSQYAFWVEPAPPEDMFGTPHEPIHICPPGNRPGRYTATCPDWGN